MPDWSPWFRLTIAVLATWRVAHMIAHEDGPFDMIVRLRARAGAGLLGQIMDCPYCLSVWVAAPFALSLASSVPAWCAACLAISGGAALIEYTVERLQQHGFAPVIEIAPAEPAAIQPYNTSPLTDTLEGE